MEDPPARQQTMPPEFRIQASPLLRLPPELRNQIFQDVLAHAPRIIDPSYRLPGLLTSCRQVFGETQAMYYFQTHFYCRSEKSTIAWLTRLPAILRALIPEIRYDIRWILAPYLKLLMMSTGCPGADSLAIGLERCIFLSVVRQLEEGGVRLGKGVLKANSLFIELSDATGRLIVRRFRDADESAGDELWTDQSGSVEMELR